MNKGQRTELPSSPEAWIEEIRAAYADAREAIPFGPAVDHRFGEQELFHLAPAVALKFRKLPCRGATLKRATEAALSSYVANVENEGTVLLRFSAFLCLLLLGKSLRPWARRDGDGRVRHGTP